MTTKDPDDSVQKEQFDTEKASVENSENETAATDKANEEINGEALRNEEPEPGEAVTENIESLAGEVPVVEEEPKASVDADESKEETVVTEPIVAEDAVESKEEAVVTEPIVTEDTDESKEETVIAEPIVAEDTDESKEEAVVTEPIVTEDADESKEEAVVTEPVVTEDAVESKEEAVDTEPVVPEDADESKEEAVVTEPVVPEDAVESKEEAVVTEPVVAEDTVKSKEETVIAETIVAEDDVESKDPAEAEGLIASEDSGESEESTVTEQSKVSTAVGESEDTVVVEDAKASEETGKSDEPVSDHATTDKKKAEAHVEAEPLPEVDYSFRSKTELVETLELLIENRPLNEIVNDVETIKVLFYKKFKQQQEEVKKSFLDNGGNEEDFKPIEDQEEIKIKNLLSRFRGKKSELNKQLEIEKQENLRKKYDIIDKIKDLVNREESINKTFQEFRDLQSEWHSIGIVPQSSVRNLWETYNYNVEIFYDYIKINKELRDLDFKKNQVEKIKLCEKAEDLLLEQNAVSAFRRLQEYHQRWREIGPVPRESRSELWERFKTATSSINKSHHEYFEKQKDDQKKNLDAKTELCEKVEAINEMKHSSFRDWDSKAKEVVELQKAWRTIGFAPKKHNNSIYQRFRESCDSFFQAKRKFYAENKEVQVANMQLKTELCEQAEALQNSTEWKETTDALIKLQKRWKEIGSVPRKHSDRIWKRFRKACDHFFEKKSEHFSGLDSSFEDNLKLKEKIVEELNNFDPGEDIRQAFDKLKDIQKRWTEIGFVPFKNKDDINNQYRSALNDQFDRLKIDEEEKAILKYQNKIENLRETPKVSRKLRTERDRFLSRIKQLENDIVVLENNIGFFSKSSNADSMIKEVQSKIDNARKTIQVLEEKIRMIDQSGLDE